MDTVINDPVVMAELAALHEQYEAALVSNDADKLITFFWDSSLALRFGVAESLYGARAIAEFRQNRPVVDLARTVSNLRIVTFGSDCATITLEFERMAFGLKRHGRQSQVWRKFEEGWKVVSAHVSFVPESYVDHAAALVGLPLQPQYRDAVRSHLERAAVIARPLLAMELAEEIESAPVFEP
jgi:hypothetical protein